MAIFFHHMAILFTLIFTWFVATKARLISDRSGNLIAVDFPSEVNFKNRLFSSDEYVPNLEFDRTFRSPRKIMRPRATRVGGNLDLFTARGYGKRSNKCTLGACKKEMALFSARRFGKREPEKITKLICMITDCNDNTRTENIGEDFANSVERRNKEIPEETSLDDD